MSVALLNFIVQNIIIVLLFVITITIILFLLYFIIFKVNKEVKGKEVGAIAVGDGRDPYFLRSLCQQSCQIPFSANGDKDAVIYMGVVCSTRPVYTAEVGLVKRQVGRPRKSECVEYFKSECVLIKNEYGHKCCAKADII